MKSWSLTWKWRLECSRIRRAWVKYQKLTEAAGSLEPHRRRWTWTQRGRIGRGLEERGGPLCFPDLAWGGWRESVKLQQHDKKFDCLNLIAAFWGVDCWYLGGLPLERTTNKSGSKMERRNDDQSIQDARTRYLERKRQRIQESGAPWKETS